jgi:hypothetical protein
MSSDEDSKSDVAGTLKDAASFVSENFSLMSTYAKKARDIVTGNIYNETTDEWNSLPNCSGENGRIFKELDAKGRNMFLTDARVYYQAQIHLCLYYSLVQRSETVDFEEIYNAAKTGPYWVYVDNSNVRSIGDYALLELCIDCVMLKYLLPHLPKEEAKNLTVNSVKESLIAKVFELVYYRLLRHLCPLIEALIELNGIESRAMMTIPSARAMMTISSAKFLITRSLNRQSGNQSAGNRKQRLGSPLPELETTPKADVHATRDGVISTYNGGAVGDDVPLLKEVLIPAEGDKKEISEITEIKRLHRDRTQLWGKHLQNFRRKELDKSAGLTDELKVLSTLLTPAVFQGPGVYYHVHKHASVAIGLAEEVVRKVCPLLYVSQEQVDDGYELNDGEAIAEKITEKWIGIVNNVSLAFKHYAPGESFEPEQSYN